MIITRSQARSIAVLFAALACMASPTRAQVTRLGGFNPPEVGSIMGLGFNPITDTVWVYGLRDTSIYEFSRDGDLLSRVNFNPFFDQADVSFLRQPAEIANEFGQLVDLDAGATVFIAGSGSGGSATIQARVYASNGAIEFLTSTQLFTDFGARDVEGGAFHHQRETLFLISGSSIAEIDPLSGTTINSFPTNPLPNSNVNASLIFGRGDLEVSDYTGNLFVVGSISSTSIAEITPEGQLVQLHDVSSVPELPGNGTLNAIALDERRGEVWVVEWDNGDLGSTRFTG